MKYEMMGLNYTYMVFFKTLFTRDLNIFYHYHYSLKYKPLIVQTDYQKS